MRSITRSLFVAGAALMALGWGPATAQDAHPDTSGVIDTQAAWERVSVARDAAANNQHHDAVTDYLEALAKDARLVEVVAKEIAYQKLWREDADQAIFYFNRYLARHPDNENRDVRRGLALAYSWSGRQKQAIAIYRQLVKEDPADGGARVGLGRTLIWNNQLSAGYSELRAVETEFSGDGGAGRQSSNFLLTYLDGYTTNLGIEARGNWDSDDLDTYRLTVTGAVTAFGNQLLHIIPAWTTYRQPGHSDISAPRVGLGLVGSFAHNWSYHAYGWFDFFTSKEPLFGSPEKLSWNQPGGDVWFTWLPAARWRIDFGGNSSVVETFYAMNQHLHYEQASLSADWRFARHFSAGVAGQLADYSDGNSKDRIAANLRWRKEGKWEIHLGPDFYYMDFAEAYPGGYWAPDWVRNANLGLTLKTRSHRWTYRINGSIGLEKEAGSDSRTVGGISGRVGWRLGSGTLLAAEVGHSRNSFSTDSGYARTFATLSLKAAF